MLDFLPETVTDRGILAYFSVTPKKDLTTDELESLRKEIIQDVKDDKVVKTQNGFVRGLNGEIKPRKLSVDSTSK